MSNDGVIVNPDTQRAPADSEPVPEARLPRGDSIVSKVYRTKDQEKEGGEITYRVVRRHDSRKCCVVFDLMETRDGIESRVGWFEHISTAYFAKWAMEERA